MKAEKGSKNIFKDLGFSNVESANLEARSSLMILLGKEIKKLGLSQAEIARRLGVKPPRISELMNGKIDKFSLDLLVVYLARLGKRVGFNITKKAA
ncbi:MAG: XRE family transcriptional regulator [Deltaproteobacteria bacterium]|nr:XRE family transcriptional regulator [Deltaproteobacteria bacterium]MBI4373244.1 XRE family transcriptional regulator [Deltaproteobacteria bacterium]